MGGARCARRARVTWAGVLLAVPVLFACAAAQPLTPIEGGFRNARRGYQLGVPPKPSWQGDEVEGSLLAFRDRSSATRMTFSSRCGEPITRPDLLARHLRIGIPANVVREAGPVEIGSLAGWQQVFDVDAPRGAVRMKTVTFAVNGCALDWALIARETDGFEAAEQDFDAWWRTLVVDPAPGTATAADAAAEDGTP